MSGKGRFTKKGQGKGKAQAKGGNSSASSTNKKQFVTDFSYYLGSAKQASDYETTIEFVINYIKKIYNYGNGIATTLESLELLDTSWLITMCIASNCRHMRITGLRCMPCSGSDVLKQQRTKSNQKACIELSGEPVFNVYHFGHYAICHGYQTKGQ